MLITAVLGSPSRDGNTCVLAREILRGAKDAGAEVDEIFLAEYNIEFCRGCISKDARNMCMSAGRCVIDDDVNMLRQKLYDSDGIVLASPSYGMMPSARMKNFMVDRIGMYTAYTSSLGGKYFVGASTCGGIGAKKVAKGLADHFINGFHMRAYGTGCISAKLGYDRVEDRPEVLEEAYRLGKRLVNDIETGKKYPLQKLYSRAMKKLVVRRIILKNIYANKDGRMKAVYENLVERNLIKP